LNYCECIDGIDEFDADPVAGAIYSCLGLYPVTVEEIVFIIYIPKAVVVNKNVPALNAILLSNSEKAGLLKNGLNLYIKNILINIPTPVCSSSI